MKTVSTSASLLSKVLLVGSLGLLAGCATDTEPDNIQFGSSVRHMIALQTTAPNAGAPSLDGEKAEGALRAYRGHKAEPKEVDKPVVLSVGGDR